MTKIIPYNDYGGYIPKEHNVIGTVRPMFSRNALRASWKIIEIEDEHQDTTTDKERLH